MTIIGQHFEEVCNAKGEEELATLALQYAAQVYRTHGWMLFWVVMAALGWATALPLAIWWWMR
jgi:hypothetical protein